MWGGWYDSPAMMKELGEYLNIAKMFMNDPICMLPAECALWIDETAFAYADPAKEHYLAKQSRVNVGQCGVPFDFYEIGDFSSAGRRYVQGMPPDDSPSKILRDWSGYHFP